MMTLIWLLMAFMCMSLWDAFMSLWFACLFLWFVCMSFDLRGCLYELRACLSGMRACVYVLIVGVWLESIEYSTIHRTRVVLF